MKVPCDASSFLCNSEANSWRQVEDKTNWHSHTLTGQETAHAIPQARPCKTRKTTVRQDLCLLLLLDLTLECLENNKASWWKCAKRGKRGKRGKHGSSYLGLFLLPNLLDNCLNDFLPTTPQSVANLCTVKYWLLYIVICLCKHTDKQLDDICFIKSMIDQLSINCPLKDGSMIYLKWCIHCPWNSPFTLVYYYTDYTWYNYPLINRQLVSSHYCPSNSRCTQHPSIITNSHHPCNTIINQP